MWTFNGVRIFVQEISEDDKQTIARLNPLNGGTIHQWFGYEDQTASVNAFIVGDTDKASLQGLAKTGSSYELVGPEGSLGNYFLSDIKCARNNSVYQTIRTDLDCTSPVYAVTMELYKDV